MSKAVVFGACATIYTTIAPPASADMTLKIIAAPNMRPALPDMAAAYQRSNNPKLSISYVAPEQIKSQVEAGASLVVISLKAMVDALAKEGHLTDVTIIARSSLLQKCLAMRDFSLFEHPDGSEGCL